MAAGSSAPEFVTAVIAVIMAKVAHYIQNKIEAK